MGFSSEFQKKSFPQYGCFLSASTVILHIRYFTSASFNLMYMCVHLHISTYIDVGIYTQKKPEYIESILSSVLPRYFREDSSTDSSWH